MNTLKTLIMALAIFTVGCASSQVVTNSTAFYIDDYSPNGSIAVIAAEAEINNSLEFMVYKRKFESQLSKNGYTIQQDPNKAKYLALVAYGIDDGKTGSVTTPIFGQTGGGTTYSSGTVSGSGGSANYSGSTYTMPTYGVIGSSTSNETTYNRAIALDIVVADSLKSNSPQKVYEGRTKSTGSCSVIVEVFDEMLEAMFDDFPGENGRNRKLEVPAISNC